MFRRDPTHIGESDAHLFEVGLPHIEEMIDGDPIKPCPELALTSKGAQLGDHLDKDLLSGVLSLFTVPEHSNGNVENPRLVASN